MPSLTSPPWRRDSSQTASGEAGAVQHFQVAEFHGWLAQQPPEARVAAVLAEVALEAVVVAFAMGNAREP